VREEKGLTYGIYSILTHTDAADLWQIYYSATPENSQKAKETTKEAYLEFYRNGVSEAELEGAKNALLSSFNLRFSSLLNIAEMLYEIQVDDLGIDFLKKRQDYVNAVTLDEVNGAIKKYLPAALEAREGTRWFEIIGKN
jgi:zinc protease